MTDSSIPDVPAFADALSPLERAKLGLQDELSVFEIGLVTYPEKDTYPDRERLTKFLLEAIKNGWLAAYGNPDGWTVEANSSGLYRRTLYPRCDGHEGSTVPDYSQFAAQCGLRSVRDSIQRTSLSSEQYKGDWCLVMRADYLAFLATPAAFGIPVPDQWKATHDEPAPIIQSELDKQKQGAAVKHAAIDELLDEIDKRVAENGAGFNRNSLPGTKVEFLKLLKAYHRPFEYLSDEYLSDEYLSDEYLSDEYLKGKCRFQHGAKPKQGKGKAIWALFPEYDLK